MVRAVVVGTSFGARVHVPALRLAGVEVVGLVGRDPERTTRRAERVGVTPFTDLEEALRLGPDLVAVATPPHTHDAVVRAALAAEAHVICEKPFALDASEAQGLLEAAGAAGVVHALGHEFRFAEARATARRAIRAGRLGRPVQATFVSSLGMLVDGSVTMPDWWWDPDRGGGWAMASGSHVIDQIGHWFGAVDMVGAVTLHACGRPADDGFLATLRSHDGVAVTVAQTAADRGPPLDLVRVVGTDATLSVAGGQVRVTDGEGARELPLDDDLRLPDVSDHAVGRFGHLELGPYLVLVEQILGAIRGEVAADPTFATFADGVSTQRVLDAIRRVTPGS